MTSTPRTWPSLRPPVLGLVVVGAIVLGAFVARLILGTVWLPLPTVISALWGSEDRIATSIVVGFRLPRGLTAMMGGAALAISGLQMQTLLRNPLAGPWILGVVGSARLGVAVMLTLGPLFGLGLATTLGPLASSALTIGAIVGAAAGMLGVGWLARRISPVTLLIVGVLISYIADGAARLLIILAPMSHKGIFTAWNDGSFDKVTWPQLEVFLAIGVTALVASIALIKILDAFVLGDRYAASLGHAVARGRAATIAVVAALAGTATAFCGTLWFIDVAVPHIARTAFRTTSHRTLMLATGMIGALLGLVADLATSLPGGQQVLHVNHATAIIGGPVLLWMLLSRREGREMQFQ